MRPTRSSSGSASSSDAESPSRPSASAAGPAPAAAWLSRRVRSFVACSMPDIATPASSPARSSTWIEATVVPSDCASFAWASTVARPERTMATPAAAAAVTAAAVATATRREKSARRVFAASISRPSRPKPRLPASPIPSSSARTSRPPTTASRTLTRFSVISLPFVGEWVRC